MMKSCLKHHPTQGADISTIMNFLNDLFIVFLSIDKKLSIEMKLGIQVISCLIDYS